MQQHSEQTAGLYCLATPHQLLWLIHSSVRCQGFEPQTHLHPKLERQIWEVRQASTDLMPLCRGVKVRRGVPSLNSTTVHSER